MERAEANEKLFMERQSAGDMPGTSGTSKPATDDTKTAEEDDSEEKKNNNKWDILWIFDDEDEPGRDACWWYHLFWKKKHNQFGWLIIYFDSYIFFNFS